MSDISKIQTNGNTYDVKDATARETAESKVSSVNIGTVTTGDEPSVTNSGTDKDVVMDFVFPSGGGLDFENGTIAAGATFQFTERALGHFYAAQTFDVIYFDGEKMNYITDGAPFPQASDDSFVALYSANYILIKG